MGEIRSTIDIMMERTRGMSLSSEEKEKIRQEDIRKRAKGFRIKLLDNPSDADEILSSLSAEAPEDKQLLESLLWEEMIDTLPTDGSASKHLDLMEQLPQGLPRSSVLAEIRALLKSGGKEKSKDRKKMLTRERKRLASLGISGSAVVPKIPTEATADSGPDSRLEELKIQLKSDAPEEP